MLAASARASGCGNGVACGAVTGTLGILRFACFSDFACTGALASMAMASTAPQARAKLGVGEMAERDESDESDESGKVRRRCSASDA
ncbi:hypothetical protein THI4931_22010 [Pandoraea sputorum]|nr:hypothetical protein THI4931_22010 [Pandoraea sputorum]